MSKHRTWVEINKQALRNNIQALGSLLNPETTFCAVVKANAYGHGIEQVVSICNALTGVIPDRKFAFAVDNIDEALQVRRLAPEALIIVLGYTLHDRLVDAIENEIELTIYDIEVIRILDTIASKLGKQTRVHLKLETGTNRQGITVSDLPRFLKGMTPARVSNVILSGVSTHFANIEDTSNYSYAKEQLARYNQMLETIKQAGFKPRYEHTACSAATILYPETHGNLVRAGISMYGFWSSKETKAVARQKQIDLDLQPVLTWKTRIAQIKSVPKNSPIGYGLTEQLHRNSKVAIIPVGYYDGWDRGLSSIGEVLVSGTKCKVLGRICMNMSIIDVTDADKVNLEDEVVLIGQQGNGIIKADHLAEKTNTIHYEVITRINPQLPRIIT